jgi:diguanylate cyclase (GGDEF)-like protein
VRTDGDRSDYGETVDVIPNRGPGIDALTGLPAGPIFRERLPALLAEWVADGAPCAVIVIDIDRFRYFYDMHGMVVGDEVITALASRIRAAVPAEALVGRVGGEEFAIVVPNVRELDEAQAIATRLMTLCAEPVVIDSDLMSVTVSAGVVIAAVELTRRGKALDAAYQALADTRGWSNNFNHSSSSTYKPGQAD